MILLPEYLNIRMLNNREKILTKAALISLLIGIFVFFIKISGYFITRSSAIYSDALESVVHIAATGMAYYSIRLSSKPADKSHLYGHKNVEFFSAGVEGLLIAGAAILILFISISNLINGIILSDLDIGIYFVSFAGIINFILGRYLIKTGKEKNSIALIADGKHVLSDSLTSLGVILGVFLILVTELKILDPIIAIIIGIHILYMGYKLVRKSVEGLMQETDEEILEKISAKLISIKKPYWIDIHELRFWRSGNTVFVDFHLILPHYFKIKESHLEEKRISRHLKKVSPGLQTKIHFDYCVPNLCKWCEYEECVLRKENNILKINWTTEKLIGDPIYLIKS